MLLYPGYFITWWIHLIFAAPWTRITPSWNGFRGRVRSERTDPPGSRRRSAPTSSTGWPRTAAAARRVRDAAAARSRHSTRRGPSRRGPKRRQAWSSHENQGSGQFISGS